MKFFYKHESLSPILFAVTGVARFDPSSKADWGERVDPK